MSLWISIALMLLTTVCVMAAPPSSLPWLDKLPANKELPNPFLFNDGTAVKSKEEWGKRRAEILEAVQFYQYGTLPPAPGNTRAVEIINHNFYTLGASHRQYRVTCGPESRISFTLDLLLPKGKGPFPVILRGDWCWGKLKDEIAEEVLKRGYIVADLNRCELAPDNKSREAGIYTVWPDSDAGSVAAWAWGFHRAVDVLVGMEFVDKEKITVTGHSRGGKAALLAGATDTRVALTVPNNSGCGGAGSYKFQAAKSEAIENITKNFPFWFKPGFTEFIGHIDQLPIDQHYVKALCAPRALLSTEALGDLWANPEGTRQTHLAAKEVYKFLGVPERIGIFYREGKHEHNFEDWKVLLDFADELFFGKKSGREWDGNPFKESPKTFTWTAPQ